jgi:hypothetical protein
MINSTQGYNVKIVANGIILDLFQDEEIKLSDNITNLFDIGSIPAEFSRTIMLPGTKKNNAFFEHVYDISVTNPFLFATNQKVSAYLDFDGIYLANGYLQLNKVSVYENKFIDSYEISLFGIVSSFSRDINRLTLNDLTTLSQFNHTSSYNNISASWNRELFSGSIVYPLADYGSGYQFTSGQLSQFGMDDQEGALTVQNFKPAIRVKEVWDAIFDTTGYTYSSSFFNQDWFNDVYMLCNNSLKYPEYAGVDLETYGKIKIGAISGSGMTDVTLASGSWTTLPWYNELSDQQNFYTNGAYRVEQRTNLKGVLNVNINVNCAVNNMPGTFTANGTWGLRMVETGSLTAYGTTALQSYILFFDQLQKSRTGGIDTTYQLETEFNLNSVPAGNYYFQIRQSPNFPSSVAALPLVTLDPQSTTKSFLEITQVNSAADGRVMDIPINMPYGTSGIKLVDWIKGIQKKFNLIIYPDRNNINTLIVETFNNWYNKGQIRDFNKYVNLNNKIDVIAANNLAVNKLNFGDTLDTDYISQQFAKAANREYGQAYYVDNNNFFSQGEFNVKTTFASDPLVKITGTGLSGSVGGINPSVNTFYAGQLTFSPSSRPDYVCSSPIVYDVYTVSGTLTQGEILYYDRYAQSPITGFYNFVAGPGQEITEVNRITGEIGYGSGFFC